MGITFVPLSPDIKQKQFEQQSLRMFPSIYFFDIAILNPLADHITTISILGFDITIDWNLLFRLFAIFAKIGITIANKFTDLLSQKGLDFGISNLGVVTGVNTIEIMFMLDVQSIGAEGTTSTNIIGASGSVVTLEEIHAALSQASAESFFSYNKTNTQYFIKALGNILGTEDEPQQKTGLLSMIQSFINIQIEEMYRDFIIDGDVQMPTSAKTGDQVTVSTHVLNTGNMDADATLIITDQYGNIVAASSPVTLNAETEDQSAAPTAIKLTFIMPKGDVNGTIYVADEHQNPYDSRSIIIPNTSPPETPVQPLDKYVVPAVLAVGGVTAIALLAGKK